MKNKKAIPNIIWNGLFIQLAPAAGLEPATKRLQESHHFHDGLDYLIIPLFEDGMAGARGEIILSSLPSLCTFPLPLKSGDLAQDYRIRINGLRLP